MQDTYAGKSHGHRTLGQDRLLLHALILLLTLSSALLAVAG
jgi:hypothetical protein